MLKRVAEFFHLFSYFLMKSVAHFPQVVPSNTFRILGIMRCTIFVQDKKSLPSVKMEKTHQMPLTKLT